MRCEVISPGLTAPYMTYCASLLRISRTERNRKLVHISTLGLPELAKGYLWGCDDN